MARVLLLLPTASYRAPDFLEAARALGVEVVVASDQHQALVASGPDRALAMDLNEPEAAAETIAEFAEEFALDAVVPVDDQGVLVAALAGEKLGLAHNPASAAAATRDKAVMRQALAAAGVPQPDFRVVAPDADVARLAGEAGWPCVIKPLSLSASRGVIRADDERAARSAAARIRAILADAGENPNDPLLVERFIPGQEVAVEGLLRDGRLEVLAIFDKPDPLEGPYFEETIYVTPSRLPATTQRRITELTGQAAGALGLLEGPVHAEFRVQDQSAWVLELAARSIGGLCGRALRFGLGISLEQVILRHALNLPVRDLAPASPASGVMMLPIQAAGRLRAVRGQDAARAIPGIVGLEITIASGRPVCPLPEGDRYLGFLFARGESPREVEDALRAAHGRLEILLDPA